MSVVLGLRLPRLELLAGRLPLGVVCRSGSSSERLDQLERGQWRGLARDLDREAHSRDCRCEVFQ